MVELNEPRQRLFYLEKKGRRSSRLHPPWKHRDQQIPLTVHHSGGYNVSAADPEGVLYWGGVPGKNERDTGGLSTGRERLICSDLFELTGSERELRLRLTVWYLHFSEAIPTVDELELSQLLLNNLATAIIEGWTTTKEKSKKRLLVSKS